MSASLKKVLLECQPFKDGAATLVCIGCFNLLTFPSGSKSVRCSFCMTITSAVSCRCSSCRQRMDAPLSSKEVRCVHCGYIFTPVAKLKICVPEDGFKLAIKVNIVNVKVLLGSGIAKDRGKEFPQQVVMAEPLRSSMLMWEGQIAADFDRCKPYRQDVPLDVKKTGIELNICEGDIIEIRRGQSQGNQQGHEMVAAQFGQPSNCAFCKEFIWGIYKQGMRCAKCRLPVHHRCASKLRTTCEADLREMFGIVNFNNDDDEQDQAKDVAVGVVVDPADKAAFNARLSEAVEPECDVNFMKGLQKLSDFSDEEIGQMWTQYDQDESGTLERDEMKKFLQDMLSAYNTNSTPPGEGDESALDGAVDRLISRMDTNGDGIIQWEEFYYFFRAQKDAEFLSKFRGIGNLSHEDLYTMWYNYDRDGSGELEVDEIIALLGDILSEASRGGGEHPEGSIELSSVAKETFASFLAPDAKLTWDQFISDVVPLIKKLAGSEEQTEE